MKTGNSTSTKSNAALQECKDLFSKALAGDEKAGTTLITEKYKIVLKRVAFLLGRQDDFDDMLQDLFIYLYENDYAKLRTWSQEKSFCAWLTTIFKNNFINKGKKKKPQISIDNDENGNLLAQVDRPDSSSDSYSDNVDKYFLMAKFSESDRILFLLKMDKTSSKDIVLQLHEVGIDYTERQVDKKFQMLKTQLRKKVEADNYKALFPAA